MNVVVNPQAAAEFETHLAEIRREWPSAALKFIDRYEEAIRMIGENPKLTPVAMRNRKGYEVRIRIINGFPILMFFTLHKDSVEVLRILHGARDWHTLLDDRMPPQKEDA